MQTKRLLVAMNFPIAAGAGEGSAAT
jgi:hypothetical protein